MKIEVYIPEHEVTVIKKVVDLKEKRRLSGYIVELLKKEDEGITEEKIIELIKRYAPEQRGNKGNLEDSIQSVLGGLL